MLKIIDNNNIKQQQTSVTTYLTPQQGFRMDEDGREQLQQQEYRVTQPEHAQQENRLTQPEPWLSHYSKADGGDNMQGGRSSNNSMNVVDHHIYAAVPARIRATSSDDRSVGSLVSLHSESSTTSGSRSVQTDRKNQGHEFFNNQSMVFNPRKQSIDDSVNSDTKTICDQDLTEISPETTTLASELSSKLIHVASAFPLATTTVPSCSSPPTTKFNDGTATGPDHVVPEPVLNRIRKDCELKEEFLKRPTLPNYLSPPPAPYSLFPHDTRSNNDNTCLTPVLPPLASPEIDILSSPVNKTTSASAVRDTIGTSIVKAQPPPYYSPPSQKNISNIQGVPVSHTEKNGSCRGEVVLPSSPNSAQSNVNKNNGEFTPHKELDDSRGKKFIITDGSLGEYKISTFSIITRYFPRISSWIIIYFLN